MDSFDRELEKLRRDKSNRIIDGLPPVEYESYNDLFSLLRDVYDGAIKVAVILYFVLKWPFKKVYGDREHSP